MIKRILVGLDPDEDTPYAIDYAIRIGELNDARVTGLAVVDMAHIESKAAGGGVGSMYYAEMLREQLNEESRQTARQLIDQFETTVKRSNVEFAEAIEEGVPFERIIEDMKYHDLLVVGREPHFFYNRPQQRTDTLEKVVKEGTSPVLVVGSHVRPVDTVLLAYDGSIPAARTMQQFVHQQPFGSDVALEIVHVHSKGQSPENESILLLNLAESYCKAHGFNVSTSSVHEADGTAYRILKHAEEVDADLIVSGAHSVSRISKWMFGSTTENLLDESDLPLFVYH